jgi:threonine aldolase
MTEIINLRSDTQSLPTDRMRRAMASADLGDETYGEDPTVRHLEQIAAELMGKEAAMLVISGTMGNLAALITHCRPSDEVFLDGGAHLIYYESGGLASVAGVVPTVVESHRGHILAEALDRAIRPPNIHHPRPRLVWLENTHNRGGGSVHLLSDQRAVEGVARRNGLALHLDGARVFNAAVAQETSAREVAAGVDSVMIDLTKGLGCPLGALLLGEAAFIDEARFAKRILGGGMRQAGVIAACGLVAFEESLPRLHEDHELAQWLAHRIAELDGYRIDPGAVETNMLYVDVSALGSSTAVVAALRTHGLLVSNRPPNDIRLVTHLQIGLDDAEQTLKRMASAAAELRGGSS